MAGLLFLRCNVDPSQLTAAEVFAPVSVKRFIGGPLAANMTCITYSRILYIRLHYFIYTRVLNLSTSWALHVSDLGVTRSNEVLFPPMTKFRVKEDPLPCS